MTKPLTKMPSASNVNAGATAIFPLPIGLTYDEFGIRYKATGVDATVATMAADFDEIRIVVDGDVLWKATGAEALALLGFYKQDVISGMLPIMLARPWARSVSGEDMLSYGTADVQTMQLEIDLNSGAVTPILSLYAKQSKQTPLGKHVVLKRFTDAAGVTGEMEISDIPRGPYAASAIHLVTANVDSVEVEANQHKVFEADLVTMESFYGSRRAKQTGYFHIDFANDNRVGNALPLNLQDFRVKANFTGTGAFTILVERVEDRALNAA